MQSETATFSQRILSPDDKMRKSIERRRLAEEERKKTIFDPFKRQYGVDMEGLEKQIQEKKQANEAEEFRQTYFQTMLQEQERMVDFQEQDRQEFRKKQIEDIIAFRKEQQKFESRREFDLNDPEYLKKSIPARVGDADPRTGPSSLQMFSGEDLSYPQRKVAQQTQVRVWVNESAQEKSKRKAEEKALEMQYHEMERSLLDQAAHVESQLHQTRTMELHSLKETHQNQATMKRQKELDMRIHEARMAEAEINYTLNTDLMTENPALAYSSTSPTKMVTAHYKGMSQREREAILREQERQRKEKMTERELKEMELHQWEQQQEAIRREAILQEREKKRATQRQMQEQHHEHMKQAEEQKQRYNHLYNDVYTNRASDEFFSQFGTTTR